MVTVTYTQHGAKYPSCYLCKTVEEAYTLLYGLNIEMYHDPSFIKIRTLKNFQHMFQLHNPLRLDVSFTHALGTCVVVQRHKIK